MDITKYKRILIIGCPGSGKSTLAKRLGRLTNYEVVHLDTIYWLPNWERRDRDDFERILKEKLEMDSWVIDGNYNRTLDLRVSYADLIIYFDLPTITCLLGIIKRRIIYSKKSRSDMQEGCKEMIDLAFIKYVLRFKKEHKKRYNDLINNLDKDYLIIKNRKEIEKYFK